MDAKEYLEDWGHDPGWVDSGDEGISSERIAFLMESYHQHKLKQEGETAEERYERAKARAWEINELDPNTFDEVLRIAAGLTKKVTELLKR